MDMCLKCEGELESRLEAINDDDLDLTDFDIVNKLMGDEDV